MDIILTLNEMRMLGLLNAKLDVKLDGRVKRYPTWVSQVVGSLPAWSVLVLSVLMVLEDDVDFPDVKPTLDTPSNFKNRLAVGGTKKKT